jgi:hypothetical protein
MIEPIFANPKSKPPDRPLLDGSPPPHRSAHAFGGSSRRDAVARLAESVGESLERFCVGFGDADVYVIVDVPDNEAVTAVALTVNASVPSTPLRAKNGFPEPFRSL